MTRTASGFTILEMAVVLMVIALITGMGIYAGLGALDSARNMQTENKMRLIQNAMMDFRIKYNRLPCPSDFLLAKDNDNYGIEAANPGTCTGGAPAANFAANLVAEGAVPVRTLGLPDEYMLDGWGRYIAYQTNIYMTGNDAFLIVASHERTDVLCGGPFVINAGNGARGSSPFGGTAGAVYALISYGQNGHGAYTVGGQVMSSGSTNAQEQVNCHCNNAAAKAAIPNPPNLYQTEQTQNPANATDTYDDIVHFKMRWQMQNETDYNAERVLAQLATGQNNYGGGAALGVYKKQCRSWLTPPGMTFPVLNYQTVRGVAFTPDNQYLFVFSNLAGQNCQLLRFNGYSVANLGDPVIPGGWCPAYSANSRIAMADNGYLAITTSGFPTIRMFKQSGASFVALSSANVVSSPGVQPTILALGRNAEYIFLSDGNSYATLYVRTSGDIFRPITSMFSPPALAPAFPAANTIGSAAFSPDGKYLALGVNAVPAVRVWRIDPNNVFTPIAPAGLAAVSLPGMPGVLSFSKDSAYLSVGGGNSGGPSAISTNFKMFSVDAQDVFTAVTITGNYSGGANVPQAVAFWPDSRMVALAVSSGSADGYFLERTGPLAFTGYSATLPGTGSQINSLAVHH